MGDKIRELRVRPVIVPMKEPHQTASGTITESPLVLTDVRTEDGVEGHSILFTYTRAALRPTAELVENLGGWLIGDPVVPLDCARKLSARLRLLGAHGLTGMAVAGLDMALWDAAARRQQSSLVKMLGAAAKPIPAYGAVGYDGAAGSARVAGRWARRGFRGVKAKIGYPTASEDVEVVRAIRSAVGNDVAIMVDYNQSLSPAEAVERLRALDELGLTWIEEPTIAEDYSGHAAIARAVRTPIQCGENWWGPLEVFKALDAGASDYLMLDPMKVGGVTGWLQAAALAASRGVRVSNHLWPEISAQLLCATDTAHWLEYADWWNPVVAEPLRVEEGLARIEGVIGTGVAWNEDALGRLGAARVR
jgi:mandelate racemase